MTRQVTSSSPRAGVVAATGETLDFAGLDSLLGYHLRRAQGAVHRDYLAATAELKLTQKQTAVMWMVQGNPGVAQGAIGAALGMDRATMMVLVDRLEARGLLRRTRSRADARRRELQVTATGEQLLARTRQRVARHEARVKALFTPQELRKLESLLRRLQSLEQADHA